MKLQHQTEVAASPEEVWTFLQDTRGVVQCLPGAELVDELGDDRYQGVLRVSIGPLKMAYAGEVSVIERNASERRIVLDATGRDKRGSGAVQAHVKLQVSPDGQGARIDVISDLNLTGRVASLGRGLRDVSNRMFVQFAGQLRDSVQNPSVPSGAGVTPEANGVQMPAQWAAGADSVPGGTPSFGSIPASRSVGTTAGSADSSGGEIKVLPLVWGITRERFADFLARLSARIRPN